MALACEGKHRVPKRYAREQCNLTGFDYSVLVNVTGAHMSQLADAETMSFACDLLRPSKASHKLTAFVVDALSSERVVTRCLSAHKARMRHAGTVAVGDVVFLDVSGIVGAPPVYAAQVWALCKSEGYDEPLALVSIWDTMISSSLQTCSAKWVETELPELWALKRILCTVTYRRYTDGVVTLVPPSHRHLFDR
jgi:hypothetical protein